MTHDDSDPAADLRTAGRGRRFACILADPPWQFTNRTGKVAPEHKRLNRYGTMDIDTISSLPVAELAAPTAHLYLWIPNALLPYGLRTRKREHSRKPDELYEIMGACSPRPRMELFSRGVHAGWTSWGNQSTDDYEPTWKTYAHNSASQRQPEAADPKTRRLPLFD